MKNKIKVLQVIPKLGYGGAETGCYDLAHYLSEQNCGSFIITSGGELLKFIKKEKVKIIKLPVHSKNPILIFLNALIISFIILIYNINIVHARSRAPAWSCLLATKITSRKFVTTFHGTYNFNNRMKKFYNSVMVRSDLTIAGSNFIFSHINENYKQFFENKNRKLLVIFRGINIHYYNPNNVSEKIVNEYLSKWQIDKNDFIILMPGRLTPWKGQKTFIEALNIINQEHIFKPFTGIILGSDQGRNVYRKQLMSLVDQYRLNKLIKFINNCKEMPVAYKIADTIVSASIEPEAFGRVSVEAQSMQKPIVASNLGGSKETIMNKKTGLLYDSKKASELAKALIEFINMDKPALQTIGFEGRKNVLKKFDVEKMCNSTFTEYKKLIN